MLPLSLRKTLYYIPLAPRPSITVTKDMLDKLDAITVNDSLVETKKSMTGELVGRFGQALVLDSPHLYTGVIMRSLLTSGVFFWPMFDVAPEIAVCCSFLYNGVHIIIMWNVLSNQAHLSSRYMAFCHELRG